MPKMPKTPQEQPIEAEKPVVKTAKKSTKGGTEKEE